MIELKWRTMKVISNYFDMYFIGNNLIPPSINVYKLKQLTCKIKEEAGIKQNHFWGSVVWIILIKIFQKMVYGAYTHMRGDLILLTVH